MLLEQGFLDFESSENKNIGNNNYSVMRIDCDTAKRYIKKYHY